MHCSHSHATPLIPVACGSCERQSSCGLSEKSACVQSGSVSGFDTDQSIKELVGTFESEVPQVQRDHDGRTALHPAQSAVVCTVLELRILV